MAAHQRLNRRRAYLCAGALRKRARVQKSPIALDAMRLYPAINSHSSAILSAGRGDIFGIIGERDAVSADYGAWPNSARISGTDAFLIFSARAVSV